MWILPEEANITILCGTSFYFGIGGSLFQVSFDVNVTWNIASFIEKLSPNET